MCAQPEPELAMGLGSLRAQSEKERPLAQKMRTWIATRWSGRMVRRSYTDDLKWIQSCNCKGHGSRVWIKYMDQGYRSSPVRPGYGSGPYILSCSPISRSVPRLSESPWQGSGPCPQWRLAEEATKRKRRTRSCTWNLETVGRLGKKPLSNGITPEYHTKQHVQETWK